MTWIGSDRIAMAIVTQTLDYVTTLIGYSRVSKADGSQVHDLQRDALIGACVDPDHIYEDSASGATR